MFWSSREATQSTAAIQSAEILGFLQCSPNTHSSTQTTHYRWWDCIELDGNYFARTSLATGKLKVENIHNGWPLSDAQVKCAFNVHATFKSLACRPASCWQQHSSKYAAVNFFSVDLCMTTFSPWNPTQNCSRICTFKCLGMIKVSLYCTVPDFFGNNLTAISVLGRFFFRSINTQYLQWLNGKQDFLMAVVQQQKTLNINV